MNLSIAPKHRMVLLVIIAALIVMLFFSHGLPYEQIGKVLGAYNDGNGPALCNSELGDAEPSVGDAEPATVMVPCGSVVQVLIDAYSYSGPAHEAIIPGLIIPAGSTYFVSGLDETEEWVRLRIADKSVWVQRSATNY